MKKSEIKKKYVFLGDEDSINIEIIVKSFQYLKNKVKYLLICNKKVIINNSKIKVNEIYDPISFKKYRKNELNIFNVDDVSNKKYLNLLNQINIANNLANLTKFDLITLPINKTLFKENIEFTGMTEYLGKINKKSTIMMMHGEKFSVIPFTTHINIRFIHKFIKSNKMKQFLKNLFVNLDNSLYGLNFNDIRFLCYNPHCGENGTLGNEDLIIKRTIKNFKKIKGPYPADSSFDKIKYKTLFISTYHDQVLTPFKILNKKSMNFTLGLKYRRLSPAHGTAKDIKNKNLADNTSYLACQLF
tara:strand:- start:5433 stop:6335 length:903 start_codon:yes stop_codon:yes gene_type:complete